MRTTSKSNLSTNYCYMISKPKTTSKHSSLRTQILFNKLPSFPKKEHKTPKSQTTQPTESKLPKHNPQTQFPSPTKPKPKIPPKKYKFRFKSSWFPTPSHQNTNSTKKPLKTPTLITKRVQKCLKKRYLAFIEINSITSSHETSTSLSTECRKKKSKTSI